MSHVVDCDVKITDLDALEAAVKEELGGELIRGKKSYKWWGRFEGDYPLPEGVRQEDLGKCDHVIKVPGASYEVGVVEQKDGSFKLQYDFYTTGGLERAARCAGVPGPT